MKKSTFTVPFFVFHYLFNNQIDIATPMIDKEAIFINDRPDNLKKLFKAHLEKSILKDGKLEALLPYYKQNNFVTTQLEYEINKSEDGISFPKLTLPIEYFQYKDKNGIWGVIPHLAIEAFAKKLSQLEENLRETIGFFLEKFYDSQMTQELLPLIWNSQPKLKEYLIEIPRSPSQKHETPSIENSQFLKKIGHQIILKEKMAYGNEEVVKQILQSLKTSIHKNILITGPSQSGKTALIWEVIYHFQKRTSKPIFFETTASSLIRELSNDNNWKANIKILIEELKTEKCVLYIRNWMEMFEVGKSIDNDTSLGEYLYRFIEAGEIQIITECTENQFSKIEIIKPNYQHFFQLIKNPPLSGQLLEEVVYAKVQSMGKSKNATIQRDAIREVLRLNKRFSPYAGMPGKAIRFLERIIHNLSLTPDKTMITKDDIIQTFSEESGVPLLIIDPEISFDSAVVEAKFKKQLYGQNEAIKTIVDMLAVVKSNMTNMSKPIASFIFAGPTGVGKTELAKILAGFIFSSRKRMVRFDMSEYGSFDSISKLTGSEYNPGLLAAAIRKNPFSILLFDEIDKAHPKFNEILLQILEEGRFTDGTEEEINFCSTIIIMTSNIGVERISRTPVGFGNKTDDANIKSSLLQEIRKFFTPEIFNRIDHPVIFYPISENVTELIVRREFEKLKKREGIKYRKVLINASDEAIRLLAKKGFDPTYGARNIQRVIRKEIAIPLSKQLNQFDKEDHLIIKINAKNEQIIISTQDDALSVDLIVEEVLIADLAMEATNLRKDFEGVQNSYIFNQTKGRENYLLHKTDITEHNRKELMRLTELTLKVDSLFKKAESIENELSLAFLKLGTFRPQTEQLLADYRQQLSTTQLQLLSTNYPDKNKHFLYYFGMRLDEIVPHYIRLLEEMDFQVSVQTIWHFPKQQLAFYKGKSEQNQNWVVKNNCHIQIQGWNDDILKSATLCGVVLTVTGMGVGYYLANENNVQEWRFPEGLTQKVLVYSAEQNNHAIPPNIHKLEFYKQKSPSLLITKFQNKTPVVKTKSQTATYPITQFTLEKWQATALSQIRLEFK